MLQFLAPQPAVIIAAALLGLYYAVKTIKALELAFSLSSTLDHSVSMDTWLQFLLQSVNERSSRSIALLSCLHPSRRCFISVSSSSGLQRCSASLPSPYLYFSFLFFSFFFLFYLSEGPFPAFVADTFHRAALIHNRCQRRW